MRLFSRQAREKKKAERNPSALFEKVGGLRKKGWVRDHYG
jgi:hypothetical protein